MGASTPLDLSGAVPVAVDSPVILVVGPHDDILSLAPDRLTIEPIDEDRVRLVGGPRVGQAALLILQGTETRTVPVQVSPRSETGPTDPRSPGADGTHAAVGTLASVSKSSERHAVLATTISGEVGQTFGASSWLANASLRHRAERWQLSNIGLHLQGERSALHLGDRTLTLSSQQVYLPLRGVAAETELSDDVRVGAIGGLGRSNGSSSDFFQATDKLAGAGWAMAQAGVAWGELQLGAVETEAGPRLTTRAQAGVGRAAHRVFAELATMGTAASATFFGQTSPGPLTLRGRSLLRQGGFNVVDQSRGDQGSHDLSALLRLHRAWTVSTVSALTTIQATEHTERSAVAVAGSGLRFAPSDTTNFDATYRAGFSAVRSDPLSLASHAVGLSAERTPREAFFGRVQGQVEVTPDLRPSVGRYTAVAGYGDPGTWSVSGYVRGVRFDGNVDERAGIATQVRTSRTELSTDLGLNRIRFSESELVPTTTPYSSPTGPSYPSSGTSYTYPYPSYGTDPSGPSYVEEESWQHAVAPSVSATGSHAVTPGVRVSLGGVHRLATSQQPASWRLDGGVAVASQPGAAQGAVAVGIAGSITGYAFDDRNGNGLRDDDEPAIPDLKVDLDGVRSTLTDERGRYHFAAVPQGPHTVRLRREGWRSVSGGSRAVSVDWLRRSHADFALRPGGRIEGRIFSDANHDGRFQVDEVGVTTEEVELRDADGELVHRATVRGGLFRFVGMAAGVYTVHVPVTSLPVGIRSLGPDVAEVRVHPDQTAQVEFPMETMRSISGHVWLDGDGSGTYEESTDRPASGVWVHLSDGQVTRTDEHGRYLFRRLAPGGYQVWVDPEEKSRPHRLPQTALEITRADLFIDEDRLEGFLDPEALLALRSPSPVLHAQVGRILPAPQWAIRKDLERSLGTHGGRWTISDDSVLSSRENGLDALREGTTEVSLAVDDITSPTVRVEVHDDPWVPAEAAPSVQLEVSESDVVGLVASIDASVVAMGSRAALDVTAVLNDGRVTRLSNEVAWEVGQQGVVTVTPDGWLVADTVGRATLTATLGGTRSVPVDVEVVADPVQRLLLSQDRIEVSRGSAERIEVSALHRSHRRSSATRAVKWWITDPDIAEVAEDGTIVGLRPGRTRLWASMDSVQSSSVEVVVRAPSFVGLTVDLPRELVVEQVVTGKATVVTNSGSTQHAEEPTWLVDNPSILRVDENGTLEPIRRGRTFVRARVGGVESVPVEVRVRRRDRS